ncbi:MAG: AAA family ATPase, partial [Bacteroidota bacterium]
MVRELARLIHGKSFEYLLTRFTEPNELFGPFDIRKLREGDLVTNTEGMLPEASLIFLDELLNANSAILNSLLMVLNERVFRRGRETKQLPALMIVGASNHLPEDEALQALFDRFLIRVYCGNVDPAVLENVLEAGWKLEKRSQNGVQGISTEDLAYLQTLISQVDLSGIRTVYIDLVRQLRNAGLAVSDRRAVKLQRLIAASALLCKRMHAIPSDMWVLRYIWDAEEQQEVIAGIVNAAVEVDESPKQHARAQENTLPNADELHDEVTKMMEKWANESTTEAEKSVLKDRLRFLDGRSEWIQNEEQRAFVQEKIKSFWQQVVQAE